MGLHRFDNKKELKKLDFKNNKAKYIKIGTICISFLVVIISIIYFTYSKFTLTDTFKTAESTVDTFMAADYVLDFYISGERILDVPTNTYEGIVSCDNGATGTWNKKNSSVTVNTTKKTKCSVSLALPPSEPGLYAGLIPVTYDSSNNIVVADISSEWYNYLAHKWANAILIDQSNTTTKNKYLNADGTYKSGTQVAISDVLQMYVWVPRYKYKLFNVSGSNSSPQMIDIEFESANTAKSSGTQNNEWLTHPAFTFGTTELNGIWVGKFESSGETDNITILPNVSSLREIDINTMFNASRDIESNSKYGLSASEVDTHMMKNMEWGAVAYLTNSKYGRYLDASTCIDSGCEVWINNNSNYITGCAGSSVSESKTSSCNQWNTPNGVNASTTGNVYGIYDMSGGAWEYVMGNMTDSSGAFYPRNSGLSQPDSKYYDSYTYGTYGDVYSRGHLGDATKEVISNYIAWNNDDARFVATTWPWFVRGGGDNNGSSAGVFAFRSYHGGAYPYSWRVVLSSE